MNTDFCISGFKTVHVDWVLCMLDSTCFSLTTRVDKGSPITPSSSQGAVVEHQVLQVVDQLDATIICTVTWQRSIALSTSLQDRDDVVGTGC